jgi:hypothetical protein
MAKQTINIGAAANDGTGDPIRTAFGKVNDNFTEVYTANTGVNTGDETLASIKSKLGITTLSGSNTGDQNLAAYATTAAVAAGYQPLDSDLTAIAALTTTAYGRALLSTADAPTLRTAIGLGQTDAPTFLAQTLTGQSLTGTQATSLLDLSTTWLSTTGNPSAIKLNVTNTASGATSNLMDLQVGGVSQLAVSKTGALQFGTVQANFDQYVSEIATGVLGVSLFGFNQNHVSLGYNGGGSGVSGVTVSSAAVYAWSSGSTNSETTRTLALFQDAAGILAQRNGDNAQSFRVYDSYNTAGANFCRANLSFNSNRFELSISSLGTGSTTRGFDIGTNGTGDITFFTSGANKWRIGGTSGSLLATTDNAFDIGGSGVNRPRNLYLSGGSAAVGNYITTRDASIIFAASAVDPLNGANLTLRSSPNVVNALCIGGITSAFPAIKRNGTGIDIRLADDSGFAPLNAGVISSGATGLQGSVSVLNSTGASGIQISGSASYGCHMAAAFVVSWGSGSSLNGSLDTGLARNAAGTVKVTDGSTGTGTIITKLPTSSAGLASGTVWNNSGIVSIVP